VVVSCESGRCIRDAGLGRSDGRIVACHHQWHRWFLTPFDAAGSCRAEVRIRYRPVRLWVLLPRRTRVSLLAQGYRDNGLHGVGCCCTDGGLFLSDPSWMSADGLPFLMASNRAERTGDAASYSSYRMLSGLSCAGLLLLAVCCWLRPTAGWFLWRACGAGLWLGLGHCRAVAAQDLAASAVPSALRGETVWDTR